MLYKIFDMLTLHFICVSDPSYDGDEVVESLPGWQNNAIHKLT